ncbi:MAG: diaminopimelate epimerase [Hyphomonadaceae bacterium]|nr:diaminopimelate epimerase [Hyphomonadaceae bacterium]
MRYLKMNGCGNDFVILDSRAGGALMLAPDEVRAIASRKEGIGCDQVIALEPSLRGDVFMRIWNSDGEEVGACGNGARAVGWILMEEGGEKKRIETVAGMLAAERRGSTEVMVDMGSPLLKWEEIPLARAMDTVRLDYAVEAAGVKLEGPGAANMGNPHAVFFVENVADLPVTWLGPRVERDPLFPEGVNAGFAEVRGRNLIRLRVWERGAGLTKACGTGACAAVVAAHRAGLVDRKADVVVDGGVLAIDWNDKDDRVRMTGPVELERVGEWTR